jgi:hypothetical protein
LQGYIYTAEKQKEPETVAIWRIRQKFSRTALVWLLGELRLPGWICKICCEGIVGPFCRNLTRAERPDRFLLKGDG